MNWMRRGTIFYMVSTVDLMPQVRVFVVCFRPSYKPHPEPALNIRIKPAELDRLGENKTNRVRVNNGDYLGALGVFHHLHCLNNLRRVLHWDYYGPRLAHTTHPEGFEDGHSGK